MGLRVIVSDMYPNPPCKEIADSFHQVDTTDKVGTLEVARKEQVSAVATDQTDAAVPTVAFVAEQCGLRGISYETALRFSNKHVSRRFLSTHTPELLPKFQFFESPRGAIALYRDDRRPAVVKPINSQGSKGVAHLMPDTYERSIETAFSESRGRGVLIEELVKGHEYSVEAFVKDATVHNLAITSKYHYESNPCIDVRNTYLGDVSVQVQEALYAANTRVVEALGLPFGSTHAEFMWDGSSAYLMEIACRGGGGSISTKIVPYLTDFEPNRALLSELLGWPYGIEAQDYRRRFVVMKFFEFAPGIVREVRNAAVLEEGLLAMELNVFPRQEIRPVMSSRDRPGYFVVGGTNRADVLHRERRIQELVHVSYA
jgi:carbamoyl-phosphate synthase large subunit